MGGYQQYQYEMFDLDPQRPLKMITPPLFDHAEKHGFPPDFFKESYFDHVIFGEIPENTDFSFSKFYKCTFAASQISGGVFDGAAIYDSAFRCSELQMVNFTGTTIAHTHFRNSGLFSVSFQEAMLKSCSVRDCKMDRVDFRKATLDDTWFGQNKPRHILNLRSATITQGGATQEEVDHLSISIFKELGVSPFPIRHRPPAPRRRKPSTPER